MHAAYSAAVGGVAGGLLYGMNAGVSLPGGYVVRAPIGMAIHVGLASYLSDAFVCPVIDPMLTSYTTIAPYSCDLSAAALTPALLTLAGDRTVGLLPGALIGGLSHLAADMLDPISDDGGSGGGSGGTGGNKYASAVYGGSRMYSTGQGYQYGGCSGGCGGHKKY
jgi:hypothetical protein